MSKITKNLTPEIIKEQRKRLARAIKAIILSSSNTDSTTYASDSGISSDSSGDSSDSDSIENSKKMGKSSQKSGASSTFAKRRNFKRLSIIV